MNNINNLLKNFVNDDNQINLQRPYRVMDVANYIVDRLSDQGKPVTNLLLLKMLYYLQAYYLVTDKKPLFTGKIEKWGYGPVEPIVYSYFKENGASPIMHSVSYVIKSNKKLELIDPLNRNLQEKDQLQINKIVNKLQDEYNQKPFELVKLTHKEPMWQEDKKRIEDGVHNIEYNDQEIIEYFSNGDKWPW